tara:strand:- start:251 stop:601 length:351 start_codon:yes stop_codon:yes gene_type:complete
MDPGQAGGIANNPNFNAARNAFDHAQGVHSAYNAQQEARKAQERMMQQQSALMAQIAKGPPKPNRALKGRDYKPKFKAAGSKTESARAVSKGTYQFSNPLGMGGSGSRTGGMGGLA